MTTAAGELRHLNPRDLNPYHRNPRRGDIPAIMESLRASGQYRPIVVNRGTLTGRPKEVLAGNHTMFAFAELARTEPDDPRWQLMDVWVIDVDDDAAARIVAADNRTAELGGFDDVALLELLENMPTIDGTGYTQADIDDIKRALDIPIDTDWDGLADATAPERKSYSRTFTLTMDEAALVDAAVSAAKNGVDAVTNGSALAAVCQTFIGGDPE